MTADSEKKNVELMLDNEGLEIFIPNIEELTRLYENQEYEKFAEDVAYSLYKISYPDAPPPRYQDYLSILYKFSTLLLDALTNADFSIPKHREVDFICNSVLIANMLRVYNESTDKALDIVMENTPEVAKILTLYSIRNSKTIDLEQLFKADQGLTSMWLGNLICQSRGILGERRKIKDMLYSKAVKDYFVYYKGPKEGSPHTSFHYPYFNSTYIDPAQDASIRRLVNNRAKNIFAEELVKTSDDMNPEDYDNSKIAVISGQFQVVGSIYKAIMPLLRQLDGSYELTLIHAIESEEDDLMPDNSMFSNVVTVKDADELVKTCEENKFGTVYFAEIGLNAETFYYSNLRLAPIQITGYGHPVSSFGGEIDYFIGSKEVEITSTAEKNFSERLVLISGLAASSIPTDFTMKEPDLPEGKVIVGCVWSTVKLDHDYTNLIKSFIDRSKVNITARIMGISELYQSFINTALDLTNIFGKENLQVVPTVPFTQYQEYMDCIEGCHFAVDSYPFGSYHRIIDLLKCRKPVIVLEGDRTFNRQNAAILRRVGLDELIATTEEELEEKFLRLAEDHEYRNSLVEHLEGIDIQEALFDDHTSFKNAIDYIIKNHEILKNDKERTPVIIP